MDTQTMNEQEYTEHDHAVRLTAALNTWLESGGDYAAWWCAVSEANEYLLEGVAR